MVSGTQRAEAAHAIRAYTTIAGTVSIRLGVIPVSAPFLNVAEHVVNSRSVGKFKSYETRAASRIVFIPRAFV